MHPRRRRRFMLAIFAVCECGVLPRRRRIYRAACVDIRMCAFTPHALAHLSLSPKLYILTYARAAQRSCMGQVTAHVCMHKHGVCALSACVLVCLPVPFAYARDLTFRLAANAIALASHRSLYRTHTHTQARSHTHAHRAAYDDVQTYARTRRARKYENARRFE